MSSGESEFRSGDPGGGPPSSGESSGADLLALLARAVVTAMVEDWSDESLSPYGGMSVYAGDLSLPDSRIAAGSTLEFGLMQQLAGPGHPVEELSGSVRDFLALVVSGPRVLEDDVGICEVFWVSRGEVAEPVFTLSVGYLMDPSVIELLGIEEADGE